MKMTFVIGCMCLCTGVLYTGCITFQSQSKVAQSTIAPAYSKMKTIERVGIYVVDRTERHIQEGTLRQVEEEFTAAAVARNITVASRSDIDQVLREQRLQTSGITETAWAKVAKVLSVSAMVVISVNDVKTFEYQPIIVQAGQHYYKATANVSARLISADEAQVLWVSNYTATQDVQDGQSGSDAIVGAASVVAVSLPARNDSPKGP